MKKLLGLAILTATMTLTSCGHMRHGGCGSQCDMKDAKCKECCDKKDKSQCPMKDGAKAEEKKEEAKK